MFLTELQAVNVGLVAIGATPVNTLVNNNQPDVLGLQTTLDAASTELQAKNGGWWFNTETCITLGLDSNSRAVVPQTALEVDAVDLQSNLIVRGQYLYDTVLHTNILEDEVLVNIVYFLPWDDLPYIVQNFIQYQGVLDFVSGEAGDNDTYSKIEVKRNTALAEVKRAHLRNLDINAQNNPTVSRTLLRRGRRVTTRFGSGF